jgi:hypothetical protein
MRRRSNRASAKRGQTAVEFALTLPIFAMLLLGVFDFGRVIWANDGIANAAREAARWAIVHGGSVEGLTPCPVGPPALEIEDRLPIEGCPHPTSPSKEAIHQVARDYLQGAGGVEIEVCYGEACVGNVDTGTNGRGEPVTVTVRSTVELVAGGLFGFSGFDLSSTVTMIVNH